MLTDWTVVRRLGAELEERLRGARFSGAGLLPDGRIAVALRARGVPLLLAIDAFSSPPLVTLEDGALAIADEPGFVRALASALRGTTLTAVRARRGDRLLRLTFSSRSRFGVGDELDLYLELVPRFGNAVLVKRDTVVAAAKEFTLAENHRRAVLAGLSYELPPLPQRSEQPAQPGDGNAAGEPPYVYRRDGKIVAASTVPSASFGDAVVSREPSLLDVFAEYRVQQRGRGERERVARRRNALAKRLQERETKLRTELASLAAKRRRAGERDALRSQGEAIFATLHEVPGDLRDEAKERALKLFAEYKKLGAGVAHLERREAAVGAALEAVEALRWECERSEAEDLDDVEAAVDALNPHRGGARKSAVAVRRRKRAPLEFRTPDGSRIVVGRSPTENADVTFKMARPNDLWFHARGIPGAHVVLARDDRTEASAADVDAAASLAAFYSKGKAAAKVEIDYTQRKHVRKQLNAPPGLVWYTGQKTVAAAPRENPWA
jgi:predicted ribosome quality control (RQC) complex YloA/Tae2 family protein